MTFKFNFLGKTAWEGGREGGRPLEHCSILRYFIVNAYKVHIQIIMKQDSNKTTFLNLYLLMKIKKKLRYWKFF